MMRALLRALLRAVQGAALGALRRWAVSAVAPAWAGIAGDGGW